MHRKIFVYQVICRTYLDFTDCDLDRDRPWRSRWNLDQ